MKTAQRDIAIKVEGESKLTGALLVSPAGEGKYPCIIIAPEIFGVNAHIKDITNRVAPLGYHAIAPDFYYREATGLGYSQTKTEKGMALMQTLNRNNILKDLAAVQDYFQSVNAFNGNTGIMGFRIGGHIACLQPLH